jgi:hypothetical protein
MGLLGDEGQVEARFDLFGDSATLDARLVHSLRRTYRRLRNSIGAPGGTPRRRGSCGISFRSVLRQC